MAIAITITPAAPRSIKDSARIDMTGNDDATPSYFSIEKAGVDTAKSQVFEGNGLLFTHIFPVAGTYTVLLRAASGNADRSSGGLSVIVS